MYSRMRCLLLACCAVLALTANSDAQTFNERVYTSPEGAGVINRGDFNNDGVLDVVTGNDNNGYGLTVYPGSPDGTTQPGISSPAPAANDIALGDFNRDGNLDVAVASYGPSGTLGLFQIMLGNGDGTFRPGQTTYLQTSSGAIGSITSITAGDFNGDGLLDLAVVADKLYFYTGNGDGTFSASVSVRVNVAPEDYLQRVRVGDFDGDGRVDVAVTDGVSVWVLYNNGGMAFTTEQVETFSPSQLNNQDVTFTPADINQDGFTDLIVTYDPCPQPENPDKGYYPGCPTWVTLLSNGNGRGFHPGGSFAGNNSYFDFYGLQVADLNGDGINDIIALNGMELWEVVVWLGNPDGTYQQTPIKFITGSNAVTDVTVGDFNRDGHPDLAITDVGNNTMGVMLNAFPQAACGHSTEPLSVTVCQPINDTYSTTPVPVLANSNDSATVTSMQAYVDNNFVIQQNGSTLSDLLPLGLGNHFLAVKAFDVEGRSFLSGRNITVYNGTPGEVCPVANNSAKLCLPAADASVPDSFRVLGAGQSNNNVVTDVQLYVDFNLVYNDTSLSTYVDTTLNVSPGQHFLLLKVWDADGNAYTDSLTIVAQ